MPTGSTFRIGSITGELVLETADRITGLLKQEQNPAGVIIFSCFSRCITFVDPGTEINKVHGELKDLSAPYVLLSAGGEFCPRGDGRNHFLTYSIIACALGEGKK
jgi:hypothetical protein